MHRCPHCRTQIIIRELPHPGLFQNYRVCPHCGGRFTADRDTKYRQALFIVVSLISLVLTLFLYFHGNGWLLPTLTSYLALGLLIYWGNKKVFFVPTQEEQDKTDAG